MDDLGALIQRAWQDQAAEEREVRADLERSFRRDDLLEHALLWHNVTTMCPCIAQEQVDPECPYHVEEWARDERFLRSTTSVRHRT